MRRAAQVVRRLRWTIALVTWVCVIPGHAQQDQQQAVVVSPRDTTNAAQVVERAQQIRALTRGALDPSLNAQEVLTIDLRWSGLIGGKGSGLKSIVEEAARERRASRRQRLRLARAREKRPLPAEPLQAAYEQLRRAYIGWLRLSDSKREVLLAQHADERAAFEKEAKASLAEMRQQIATLQSFLEGEAGTSVADALALPLVELPPLVNDEKQLKAFATGKFDSRASTKDAPLAVRLSAAESELSALRGKVARLSGAEVKELIRVIHFPDPPPGETEDQEALAKQEALRDATLAKNAALEEAKRAEDLRKRQIATERARLLGVKEDLARYGNRIDKKFEDFDQQGQRYSDVIEQTDKLRKRSLLEGDKTQEAVKLYRDTISSLEDARAILAESLTAIREGAAEDRPTVPETLEIETDELLALRDDVRAKGLATEERHLSAYREAADRVVGSLHELSRVREYLFTMIPAELRQERYDAAEAAREARQISLYVKHFTLSTPRRARAYIAKLARSPFSIAGLFGAFLKLLLVLLGFAYWRRHAHRLLGGGRESNGTPSLMDRMLWYLRRVRKPLEWWALIELLLWAGDLGGYPGINHVRLFVGWVFGGWAVILFVDALASWRHERVGFRSKTAQLRLKSLKLVGWTAVALGVLLSLTVASVGRGAIYSLVLQACLILVVPVMVVLVLWWRPTIFRLAQARDESSKVLQWVVARKDSWHSFLAAAVGGAYLFASGTMRTLLSLASRSDTTQRFRAYLFRKQVARSSEEIAEASVRQPIGWELYAKFNPTADARQPIESVGRKQLEELVELANAKRSNLVAVVGERGAGKTTFVRQLAARLEDRATRVDCPPTFELLLEKVGEALECKPTAEAIKAALAEGGGRRVLCIDDVQRLVRPTIGGLGALDRLSNLVREIAGDVCWVLTISQSAWQYVRRARTERVFFDQVIALPRWSEIQIGELIRRRTEQAGISPSFEKLVVPRQIDGPSEEMMEGHREDSFYRVLWDVSDGNPAVALHYWRESLFTGDDADAQPQVRLFEQPDVDLVEDLPPTVHFVLRAIVQLDRAQAQDIANCTNLAPTDVADALRLVASRGLTEQRDGYVSIAWPWYRTITDVLSRKHLLVAA